MNKIYLSVAALILGFVGLVGCDYGPHAVGNTRPARVAELSQALRDVWIGHIFWVRHVVSNNAANKQELQGAAEKKVLANTKLIAHAMTALYGEARSQKFLNLLAINYGAVMAYSEATVAGDTRRQHAALARLESNTDETADVLSQLNPSMQKHIIRGLIAAYSPDHVLHIHQHKANEYAPLEDTGV